jgi:ATP-dependent Clp protease ATP-binding subunit ClpC
VVDRFSRNCRRALVAAEREARSLKHRQIATEHILLGILAVEESTAARGLRLLGLTRPKARRRIVRLVDVGGERVEGPIPFSPRVREIIEDAYTGALWHRALGMSIVGASFEPGSRSRAPRLAARREVGTGDLLLALIAHGDGVAAHVLAQHGIDMEKAAVATTNVRFPHAVEAPSGWPPAPPKPN